MKKYFHLFIVLFLQNVQSQIAPGDPNAVPIEFRFNHELAATDSGVGLNGSFNNWLGGVFKMPQYMPDWWKVTLELLPVTYEYKFVTYTDTVGQSGVTGYFTDPLNPITGGPFNNSFMIVKPIMIYYFLPKTGTAVVNDRPNITANISFANNKQIDLSKLKFSIDGTQIPNASSYYNPSTRFFSYTPPLGLTLTSHTAVLKIFTTAGDSAEATTTFNVESFISTGRFTFMFDSKSPNFDFPNPITRVDIKGKFNNQGLNSMFDADSDGVYTYSPSLRFNEAYDYTIIVNSGLYMNDPDNPHLDNNHKTFVIKRRENNPAFTEITPRNGTVFSANEPLPLNFSAAIFRNDSATAIDSSSIFVKYDGNNIPVTKTYYAGGYKVEVQINNPTAGRHVLEYNGMDIHGNLAKSVYQTFGVNPLAKGFYYVDGEADDKGSGTFLYPQGIPIGSADISEIKITANSSYDSLNFKFKMEKISSNTRIGFFITNKIDANYAELNPLMIKIPNWRDRGIFIHIAPKISIFLNPTEENVILLSPDSTTSTLEVKIDSSNFIIEEFSFKLSLTQLEEILGTYSNGWNYGAFSYLKNENGVVKVDSLLGGSNHLLASNVYDFAFINEKEIQERLLANFIPFGFTGAPRIAAIGAPERGSVILRLNQIDTSFSQRKKIKLLAGGGELFSDSVSVFGLAELNSGQIVTLYNNGIAFQSVVGVDGKFNKKIPLIGGDNKIYATFTDTNGVVSRSTSIVYKRLLDDKPRAKIYNVVQGSLVTMKADSSFDPNGSPLNFLWSADQKNPSSIVLNGSTSSVASFTAPNIRGEYYFNVEVTNSFGKKSNARTVIVISDSGIILPDQKTWHPAWVDSQVVYSIFVRTFSSEGTFNAVTNRLPELKELGINTIWFLPIHPTTGNLGPDNPGYATTNYFDVLENYGSREDFKMLVQAAHQLGIKITLDHVIQHTSVLHPFMKDANVYKQNSPYYPFYMWDANNNFQYLFTWVDLPSINYGEEQTRDYLMRISRYWMSEVGVDGYRCDVAWAINDIRPEGPAYWKRFRKELKEIKPDIFLLAEADAKYPRYFEDKFDAAYDWNWFLNMKNLAGGIGSLAAFDSAMQFYFDPSFPKHALPFKFLENQDEQRFIDAYGIAATKMAAALMFASPGIPHLYAGQEVGEKTFRGIIKWDDPHQLKPYYKKLIKIRKKNKALEAGNLIRVNNSVPDKVYAFLRLKDTNNVIVTTNISTTQQTAILNVPINKLSFDSTATFYLNDELNHKTFQVVGTQLKNFSVTIPPNGVQIFVLSNEPLVDIDENENILPESFSLSQNYPNPFNPSTTIRFALPADSHVEINVFNILGEKIVQLINEDVKVGMNSVVFDGRRFASGVYFYTINAKELSGTKSFTSVKKMIILK